MEAYEHDEIDGGIGAWPAFVDLLAATSLLFVAFLAVVLVWVGSGQGGQIETQRRTIVEALKELKPVVGDVYDIDTTDAYFVKLVLLEDATFPELRYQLEYLKKGARDALKKLATKLTQDDAILKAYREIRIVGHSDQDKYSDSLATFSNWELSAARAAVVARFLATKTHLDPCRLSASGLGPYYPARRPVDGELADSLKRRNRRIELEFVPRAWKSGSEQRDRAIEECYEEGDGTSLRFSGERPPGDGSWEASPPAIEAP